MAAKSLLPQIIKMFYLNTSRIISARVLTRNSKCLPAFSSKQTGNFVRQYSSGVIHDIPIVTYEEIKQLERNPEKLLIDVREPNELQMTGQIPTSINIPLGQVAEDLSASVDNGAFKAKYGRDKPGKTTEIIFHCKIGKRSQNAAELARSLGYTNCKNYLGSWTEWAEKEGFNK